MASTEVDILDRFLPELQSYLIIDDISPFLIAEGLFSMEDYLVLTERNPKKRAVVEMMQLVKRKGPDSLQSFLRGLDRSCAANSTHGGHIHLQKLFQAYVSGTQQHLSKKQKSKSMLSLLPWSKHSRSNKDGKSSPHKSSNHICNPSSSNASPPASDSMTPSDNSPSDEDNSHNSMHYLTSSQSQDSYNNPELPMLALLSVPPAVPPPHAPITDHSAIIEELQKENKKLKKDLKKEAEKYKAMIKEQSLKIENLKADKDKYKRKIQNFEGEISVLQAKDDSLVKLQQEIASLPSKIEKVIMQEKEPLDARPGLSRRTRSLGNGALQLRSLSANSTSLTSINEVATEDLKSKLMKKDKVLNSKLDELAEMCRKPSRLGRKWHSDAKLPVDHHREDNYILFSQT